jgi:exopolysaccharide biosynthesis polyprenyl glycosylphosphotransferase
LLPPTNHTAASSSAFQYEGAQAAATTHEVIHQARARRYRRGRIRQVTLASGDALAVGAPLYALHATGGLLHDQRMPALASVAVLAIWLIVLHLYGLYPRFPRYVTTSTLNELPKIFHAALVSVILTGVWLSAWGAHGLGRPLAILLGSAVVLLPLLRIVSRHTLSKALGAERVLLVGTGSGTPTVAGALNDRHDIDVVAHVALPGQWRREMQDEEVLVDQLEELVVREHVDRVLLSTMELGDTAVGDFLHWSRRVHVSLTVLPEHFDIVGVGAAIDQVRGATVVSLQPPALSRTARTLKRALDLTGALCGLVVLFPALATIAIAVRLDSPGPILFRQQRIGRGGKRFELLKFRTMVPDADAMTERLMAGSSDPHWLQLENDPRITRLGRHLRSTSLDELPQLWNVLVGHMSLVGPRPLSVRDDARVGGWGRGRLDITPGLTGLWQVLGRKSVPFEEMVKLDYMYVNNWSLWGDIKLLLQTLPAVIAGRGAR